MSAPDDLDCAAVLAQIQSYVDGELSSVECEPIERHCVSCGRCAELVRGLRETIGICREAGRAPLPESVSSRAREQVRRLLSDCRAE